jgi:hypothetical protein
MYSIGSGWYCFNGQVTGPVVSGLSVALGGIPSLEGKYAPTNPDGLFYFTVHLNTDGSDRGTATAQTSYQGTESNIAMCDVAP